MVITALVNEANSLQREQSLSHDRCGLKNKYLSVNWDPGAHSDQNPQFKRDRDMAQSGM